MASYSLSWADYDWGASEGTAGWGVASPIGDDPFPTTFTAPSQTEDVTENISNPQSLWGEPATPPNAEEPTPDLSGAWAAPESQQGPNNQPPQSQPPQGPAEEVNFTPLPTITPLSRRIREVVKLVLKPYINFKSPRRINQGRNLVSIINSHQTKAENNKHGHDYSNPVQVAWAVEVAAKLISHTNFSHDDGRGLNVAIVCLFDATLPDAMQYLEGIEDDDIRQRITVWTVHQLKSDNLKADFTIAVTAKTGGAVKEMNNVDSLNTMLDCATVAQIIIMDICVLYDRKKDPPNEIVCKVYNKHLHAIWKQLGVVNVRSMPLPTYPAPTSRPHTVEPPTSRSHTVEPTTPRIPTILPPLSEWTVLPPPLPTRAHGHDPDHDTNLTYASIPGPAFTSYPTALNETTYVPDSYPPSPSFEPTTSLGDEMDTSDEPMIECWVSSPMASNMENSARAAHENPGQHQYTSVGTQTDTPPEKYGKPFVFNPMCINCLLPGHDEHSCPHKAFCLRCGCDDHKARRCPLSPTVICGKCTMAGHDAPEGRLSLCELGSLQRSTPMTWHQQILRGQYVKSLERSSQKVHKSMTQAEQNAGSDLDRQDLGSESMEESEGQDFADETAEAEKDE